jgi:hypothetical protein
VSLSYALSASAPPHIPVRRSLPSLDHPLRYVSGYAPGSVEPLAVYRSSLLLEVHPLAPHWRSLHDNPHNSTLLYHLALALVSWIGLLNIMDVSIHHLDILHRHHI